MKKPDVHSKVELKGRRQEKTSVLESRTAKQRRVKPELLALEKNESQEEGKEKAL